MPVVGGVKERLESLVAKAVGVLVEAGRGQGASVPEGDDRRVPAAVRHRARGRPLVGGGVEQQGVSATGERLAWPVVVVGASRAQHLSVDERRLATAKEVHDLAGGVAHGVGVSEVAVGPVGRGHRRIPHHAGPDLLGGVAEIVAVEADVVVARTGGEEHLAGVHQHGMYGEYLGTERQDLPRALGPDVRHRGGRHGV